MKYVKILILFSITFFYCQFSLASEDFVNRKDVQSFITMMVTKHDFDRQQLTQLFEGIELRPEVIRSMQQPYEAKPWYLYRKHFLIQSRVDGGVNFWKEHRAALTNAERQYGVPAKVIVAIIGVESLYGAQRGKYSVLDTLATIGFDYPKRAKYFQNELAEFLILSREQGWKPQEILGSYAGAVGQPQFMPSSYRAFGVDFSKKNGHVDLFDNPDDVIGSIANYLSKHGWQRDGALYTQAKIRGNDYKKLDLSNRKPTYTLAELAKYGVYPTGNYAKTDKVFLFAVDEDEHTQKYWLAFNNFYVITRYNWSNLYALAVSELANDIEEQYYHPEQKLKA